MRLAFSVMVQSDADVMLIDEVLAVGDASFAQKCVDTLQRLHDEGRTILFVTHAMESLKSLCDRAILIEDGVIDLDGDPEEVARALPRAQLLRARASGVREHGRAPARPRPSRIADVWLENSDGERYEGIRARIADPPGRRDRGQARRSNGRRFGFEICASDRARVFAVVEAPDSRAGRQARARRAGQDQGEDREPARARQLRDQLLALAGDRAGPGRVPASRGRARRLGCPAATRLRGARLGVMRDRERAPSDPLEAAPE